MTKNIINARVTFKKSPIHVLERFSLGDSENAYKSFKDHTGLSECVILQTCNRVEIFGSGNNFDREEIKKTWASRLLALRYNKLLDSVSCPGVSIINSLAIDESFSIS